MKSHVLVSVVTLVFLASGCATTDLLGGFNLISPAEEQQLGDNLAEQIAAERNLIEDPVVAGYVRGIGERLVAVSQFPENNYRFYVIEDPSINAFAIPGGYMYVHTGLIMAADREAELAGVMVHELGHAEKRHPTQRLSRQMGAQTIAGIILGEDSGQLARSASQLLLAGGISSYSRSAELEADRIAVHLMDRSGYDPSGLVTFFDKLVALEQQAGGRNAMAALFATHPPTPNRIQEVKALIRQMPDNRPASPVGNLQTVQEHLKSIL